MLVCAQVDIWMFFNIKQVKGHDLIHIFIRWRQRLSCSREKLCGCPQEVPLSGELTNDHALSATTNIDLNQ